ncbi:baseplate protein [Staphylococcus phage MarsHill]|nr:baseplate protein [Staphylococcus phage MarsHill]QQO92824.1 baseplate protein [Staphylococcus phage Madawaska]
MAQNIYNHQHMLEDMEAMGQTIQNLIIMKKGTYPNTPNLGVGIEDYLFEILDNETISDITSNINNQINQYIVSSSVNIDVKVIQLKNSNANLNSLKIDVTLSDTIDISNIQRFSYVFAANMLTRKMITKLVLS